MDKQPAYDVSVVMSVYGNVESFEWTLRSVLRQEGCHYEVVVIDDGNTSKNSEIIRNICSGYPNVRLCVNDVNLGLTKSLIKGCALASAPFIARIDNGDIMMPSNRLSLQLKELSDPNVVVCGGGMDIVEVSSGLIYATRDTGLRRVIEKYNGNAVVTLFSHVTVMFSKKAYFECGGYNENLRVGQDTDLWPRMLRLGSGVCLQETCAVAPMWSGSISVARNGEQIRGKVARLKNSAKGKNGYKFAKIYFQVFVEELKRFIPPSIRYKLKFKKNYLLKGRFLPKNASIVEIYSFYIGSD